MSKVEEKLTLLTPGSVWYSERGKPSFVLFVTNENVPAARQKQFPPQVVFADDEGELFNVGIDRFLEQRAFHHVEYDLEQKIENLFVSQEMPTEEDAADVSTTGATEVVTQREAINQSIMELEEQQDEEPEETRGLRSTFQFARSDGLVDPVLNNLVLANALRSFAQEPNIAEKHLLTRLTFLLDETVNLDTLDETFSDTKVDAANRRGIAAITVQSAGHLETFVWDQYLGVYPTYTDGGAYGVVLLAQFVDVESAESEAEELPDETPVSGTTETLDPVAEMAALMGDGGIPGQIPHGNAEPINTVLQEQPVVAVAPVQPAVTVQAQPQVQAVPVTVQVSGQTGNIAGI